MSHIAEPLRMALLVHEAFNKFNQTLDIDIGDPINWVELEHLPGRKALTEFLYETVQKTRISNTMG